MTDFTGTVAWVTGTTGVGAAMAFARAMTLDHATGRIRGVSVSPGLVRTRSAVGEIS